MLPTECICASPLFSKNCKSSGCQKTLPKFSSSYCYPCSLTCSTSSASWLSTTTSAGAGTASSSSKALGLYKYSGGATTETSSTTTKECRCKLWKSSCSYPRICGGTATRDSGYCYICDGACNKTSTSTGSATLGSSTGFLYSSGSASTSSRSGTCRCVGRSYPLCKAGSGKCGIKTFTDSNYCSSCLLANCFK